MSLFISCSKEMRDEIILSLGELDVEVDVVPGTKATPVTSLASTTLYWGATTGGDVAGSAGETVKYITESTTTSSGAVIATGKYQTATPTAYNWYICNVPFTTSENTALSVADNGTDIVVGRLFGSSSSTPSVNLNHIFARVCSVTVDAASGYTVSAISVSMTPKTSGTYSMRSLSWTSAVDGAATGIANDSVGTKSNDIWVVPGDYTITIDWTAQIGNYTKTFSGVTRTVSILQNKTNNMTITLGGDAQAVVFTTSLAPFNAVNGGLFDL